MSVNKESINGPSADSLLGLLTEHSLLSPETLLVYQIGSSLEELELANDIDLVVVQGSGYRRRFHVEWLGDKVVEVETLEELAFVSMAECYYWYATNLVMEIGKYVRGRELYRSKTLNVRFAKAIESLRNPTNQVRLFILNFHLGSLLKQRRAIFSGAGTYYGANVEWSIVSCLAALWNTYPRSMTRRSFLEAVGPARKEQAAQILSHCVGLDDRAWEELIALARRGVEDDDLAGSSSTPPLFYPQDLEGHRLLAARSDPQGFAHGSRSDQPIAKPIFEVR